MPISGFEGINLETRESQTDSLKSWYNEKFNSDFEKPFMLPEEVPIFNPICLMDALEKFKSPARPFDKPTRVCIYYYFNRQQDGQSQVFGHCLSVKVVSGVLQEGDKMILMPLNEEVTVKSIDLLSKFAYPGQLCDICITIPKTLDAENIKQGMVLGDPKYKLHQVTKIRAKIIVYDS